MLCVFIGMNTITVDFRAFRAKVEALLGRDKERLKEVDMK